MTRPQQTPIVVADVGNSYIKVGTASITESHVFQRVPIADVAQWELPDCGGRDVALVGVVSSALEILKKRFRAAGAKSVRVVGEELPIPLELDYGTPSTLGMDRVVACFGAHRITGGPALVLDAGSAITLDWVDRKGVFRGGAIAPGLRALAEGLKGVAPALDVLPPDEIVRYPGRDTASSLAVGVSSMAAGGLHYLIHQARVAASAHLPLIVTGGDAETIVHLVSDDSADIIPGLLFRGLAMIHREAST